jgi:hypothetical protein
LATAADDPALFDTVTALESLPGSVRKRKEVEKRTTGQYGEE